MHPALWTLMRLNGKASLRRLLRGAKTVRGAIVLAILVLGFAIWFGSAVVTTFAMRGRPEGSGYGGMAAPYVPIVLLAMFLQSVLGRGGGAMLLAFSPAEVDFLFPAPFHRRDLLLFKLVRKGMGVVSGSLAMSLTPFLVFFGDWLAMFVGMALALAFVMLASLAAALGRLIISEAADSRARRIVLYAVAALAALAVPRTVSTARVLQFSELAASFRATWPGRVLLAPFEVFSNAMLAERWFPDLLGWAAAGAAIDLALLALVLRLDADYLEWSAAISERAYEQQKRMRRTGGFVVAHRGRSSRFRFPQLPWLRGVGPITWRQMVQSSRTASGVILMILMVTVALLILNWYYSARSAGAPPTAMLALGLISYFSYVFALGFPVSFRGDVNQLDFLKTLPVPPLAMAVGQLAGPAIILAAVQVAIMMICCVATASGGGLLVSTIALALPVDLMLLTISNLVFLIYPVRSSSQAPTDLDLNAVGRGLVGWLIQTGMLLPLVGVPAGLGVAVYLASGSTLALAVITAWLALMVELPPMWMLVAWAFERFDPATETPT
jgi:hypothetical protein